MSESNRTAPPTVTSPDDRAWPPLLKTSDAARYCGFETVFGLHKAWGRGRVFPAGRRGGGKGTYMWRREDLDRFLRGEEPTNKPPGYERPRIGRPPQPRPMSQAEWREHLRAVRLRLDKIGQ